MEPTYFRINASEPSRAHAYHRRRRQFVSYLEGCTAPRRRTSCMPRGGELVALDDAEIKYSTVQNWYPGDENGLGGT
jgi:Fe-S cluster assembly protein SufB